MKKKQEIINSLKKLEEHEYHGLKEEYIELAEKHLNSSDKYDILSDNVALPMFEMFMLGYSFEEINDSYPGIPIEKLILTAAIKEWIKSKENMSESLYNRVTSKLIKSATQQVEFLTDLVVVSNIEVGQEIKAYIADPKNNPLPSMRIRSLKDYEQVLNMIGKLTDLVKDIANQNNNEVEEVEEEEEKVEKPKVERSILAELSGE